jgi:hypothetical protein
MKSMTHGNQLDFDIRIEELVKSKNEILEENEALRNEVADLEMLIDTKAGRRITANRQLLILHYLKFYDNLKLPSKEKKYNLLHFIINITRQTVKDFLNYREQPETDKYKKIFNEKDLYYVLDLFKEVGLLEEAKEVDFDIIKFKF